MELKYEAFIENTPENELAFNTILIALYLIALLMAS
jgi:hypothetical protein